MGPFFDHVGGRKWPSKNSAERHQGESGKQYPWCCSFMTTGIWRAHWRVRRCRFNHYDAKTKSTGEGRQCAQDARQVVRALDELRLSPPPGDPAAVCCLESRIEHSFNLALWIFLKGFLSCTLIPVGQSGFAKAEVSGACAKQNVGKTVVLNLWQTCSLKHRYSKRIPAEYVFRKCLHCLGLGPVRVRLIYCDHTCHIDISVSSTGLLGLC